MTSETFVIAGAGLAGARAAATLRKEGFDGRVVLVGAEPHAPYDRPPLSKDYLRGEKKYEDNFLDPPGFYSRNGIERRFGTSLTRVAYRSRTAYLSSGEELRYDALLIATGSRNRHLNLPGADLAGVHSLRTVDDSDGIRKSAMSADRAVIVGMGFIGSEVAASLRRLGLSVTVIEHAALPLERALGPEIGSVIRDIHADEGVEMIFGEQVARFEGAERVERVVTASGRSVDADLVVVGVGVEPNVDPVRGAGVQRDSGIVVDEYTRTNVPGIFAAGDVANHYHPVFKARMRVEHWNNAFNQGRVAALNMLGKRTPYDDIHSFWSDQYDYHLEYAGWHQGWDDLVVRGSLDERDFVAFYLKDGLVTASVGIGRDADVYGSMDVIRSRTPVDGDLLRDDGIDLRSLAA